MRLRINTDDYHRAANKAGLLRQTSARWIGDSVTSYERYLKEKRGLELPVPVELSDDVMIASCTAEGRTPDFVRSAVRWRLEREDAEWTYRYERATLERVIFVEAFLGHNIGYSEAEKIMDAKIERRRQELSVVAKSGKSRKECNMQQMKKA